MKINNTKEDAITEGRWKKPGANFYNKLKEEDNFKSLVKEAYLITSEKLNKDTVFSNSNCKYPHHIVKDNELRLSIPGVKAAINRLRQQGAYEGEAKEHIDRHLKELELNTYIHENNIYIEEDAIYIKNIIENFNDIESYLFKDTLFNIDEKSNIIIDNSENIEYDLPLSYDKLPEYLKKDPIHVWRSKNGIELIHKKPTLEELNQIWENWQNMDNKQKEISDKKSLELFGMTNEDHYNELLSQYDEYNESKNIILDYKINENIIESGSNNVIDKIIEEVEKANVELPKKIKDKKIEYDGKKYPAVLMPDEISDTIKKIYNYISKNIKYDNYLYDNMKTKWKLQSPEETFKKKKGICFDFSALANYILDNYDIKHKEILYSFTRRDDEEDPNGIHSTILFKENGKWYCLETIARFTNEQRGIYGPFNKVSDYIDSCKRSLDNVKVYYNSNYKTGMNYKQYVKSWNNSKFTNNKYDNIITLDEYVNLIPINENYFLSDNINNEEEYVPVYVICESYTEESVKAVNISMSDDEIKRRMKIANLIRFLTKGDTYTHTLISFDDTLTKMYSFDKEGMVTDNIITNPDWTYTNQIYIAVVFVTKKEKELMQKECEYLYNHVEDTKYAYFNFVKMLAGKGDKMDKRFVCSSFVGYILNKATSKNLHRDYINLRPEDMTILPRSFYVITVKNRDDFIKHKEDIKARVKALYDDNIEDIRDYNNYIPKIIFKDTLKKYNSVTQYLDKILKKGQTVPIDD